MNSAVSLKLYVPFFADTSVYVLKVYVDPTVVNKVAVKTDVSIAVVSVFVSVQVTAPQL